MRWLALAALAACTKEPTEMFPINPGGGGGIGGVMSPDARPDTSGDGGGDLVGRVCVLSDARNPTTCAATGAGGLTVTLSSATTTTAADGAFTLARPTGTGLVWHVTGTNIEPTAMQLGTATTIPALSVLLYGEMLSSTSATVVGGDGSLIAQVTHAGAPVVGVTAASTAADSSIYYDGASAVDWSQIRTGSFGVVWIPSVITASATLDVDDGSLHTFAGIPIFAGTITFAALDVP